MGHTLNRVYCSNSITQIGYIAAHIGALRQAETAPLLYSGLRCDPSSAFSALSFFVFLMEAIVFCLLSTKGEAAIPEE